MDTIAGDVLLSSAFLAYGGYFDQQMRSNVWSSWAHHMDQAEIKFRNDLARTEVRFTALTICKKLGLLTILTFLNFNLRINKVTYLSL